MGSDLHKHGHQFLQPSRDSVRFAAPRCPNRTLVPLPIRADSTAHGPRPTVGPRPTADGPRSAHHGPRPTAHGRPTADGRPRSADGRGAVCRGSRRRPTADGRGAVAATAHGRPTAHGRGAATVGPRPTVAATADGPRSRPRSADGPRVGPPIEQVYPPPPRPDWWCRHFWNTFVGSTFGLPLGWVGGVRVGSGVCLCRLLPSGWIVRCSTLSLFAVWRRCLLILVSGGGRRFVLGGGRITSRRLSTTSTRLVRGTWLRILIVGLVLRG